MPATAISKAQIEIPTKARSQSCRIPLILQSRQQWERPRSR
jgi:hypothetical protein